MVQCIEECRVIDHPYEVCCYCGNDKKQKWDEMTDYYECDCQDTKEEARIKAEIRILEVSMPKKKFKFVDKPCVVKI